MASPKKGTYNALKLKPITGKKRRNSDLVLMWNSICHVTWQVLFKVHLSLLEIWGYTRLWIWHDEIHDVKEFLKQYLPQVPEDFSHSWRDGKLLCKLLNKLHPGCIPEAENLDPNYGLRNMYIAFDVLETKFGITPIASVEQLVVCIDGSELKLLEVLSKLKSEIRNKPDIPKLNIESSESKDEETEYLDSQKCIAKGTGLLVAFVKRTATFIILCSSMIDINIVIEIKGPLNTICRERITKRSPKKKLSTSQLEQNSSLHSLSRSMSCDEKTHVNSNNKLSDAEKSLIPLEYDIHMNQIKVSYIPLIEGRHIISILFQGQHIFDSPYTVHVNENVETYSQYSTKHLKPSLKSNSNNDSINKERRKGTVKFHEPMEKIERIGKVTNRKILRHIVKIHGKDIVVDASDIDHLAAALLKMDYDFQTDPSKTRRNSWGFTGDAERKVSVIRQFCIPPQEMEAQHLKLLKRCRSSTFNSNSKIPLKRSTSFENEDVVHQLRLETVSESSDGNYAYDLSKCKDQQDEEVFAEIDEDFESVKNTSEDIQVEYKMAVDAEGTLDANKTVSRTIRDPNESKDCEHKSLLEVDTSQIKISEVNVKEEFVPPNDLTGASETLVGQIKKNKMISGDKMKKRDEFLNNSALHKRSINVEQNRLYYNSKMFLERSEFQGMIENIQNYKERKIEESTSAPDKLNDELQNLEIYSNNKVEISNSPLEVIKKSSSSERLANLNSLNKLDFSKKYLRYSFKTQLCKHCKERMCNFQRSKYYYKIMSKNKKLCQKVKHHESSIYKHVHERNYDFSKPNSIESKCSKHLMNTINKNIPYNVTKFNTDTIYEFDHENPLYLKKSKLMQYTHLSPRYIKEKTLQQTVNRDIIDFSFKSKKNVDSTNIKSSYITLNSKALSCERNIPEIKLESKKPAIKSCIQEHNLVSLGQYHFKQFNPFSEKKKGSLIKNKIKKLENAMLKDSQKVSYKLIPKEIPGEKVNIKSKLIFWENAYQKNNQTKQEHNSEDEKLVRNQRELFSNDYINDDNISFLTTECSPQNMSNDFSMPHDDTPEPFDYNLIPKAEGCIKHWVKETEAKQSSHFDSSPKSRRSFSDPGVLDPSYEEFLQPYQAAVTTATNPTSSTDNLSSSTEIDDVESSIDDGLSSTDALISTEDEYIDDEIPDNTLFTYWGDINSLVEKWKNVEYAECDHINLEMLKNQYQYLKTHPEECKVFGIATYFGYVAVKNRFQVLTKGAGPGNLSVSVEGFGKHDVGFVSVKYMHKDIYEVTYQVLRPGLYLIYLRWMEKPIVGSPFLCKVTF